MVLVALVACTTELLPDPADVGLLPLPELWVVVHPTDAPPPGPGLVHLDADGAELGRLPLPPGLISPHALTDDGTSLWVSGYTVGQGSEIFQVDPATGPTGASIPLDSGTEGLVADGDGFWVAGGALRRVDATGATTDHRPGAGTIQDLAFDGTDLWYLTNGSLDTVTRVGENGRKELISERATADNMGYAMTWSDGELLVVDTAVDGDVLPAGTPVVRHIDPYDGTWLGTSLLPVHGWITALAVAPPPPEIVGI